MILLIINVYYQTTFMHIWLISCKNWLLGTHAQNIQHMGCNQVCSRVLCRKSKLWKFLNITFLIFLGSASAAPAFHLITIELESFSEKGKMVCHSFGTQRTSEPEKPGSFTTRGIVFQLATCLVHCATGLIFLFEITKSVWSCWGVPWFA